MTDTAHHLEIYGIAWSGARCVYQYSVTREDAEALRSLKIMPERYAGDFQSVLDWRLVRSEHTYYQSGPLMRRCDHFKTLRGWRAGMTNRRFNRLANGY